MLYTTTHALKFKQCKDDGVRNKDSLIDKLALLWIFYPFVGPPRPDPSKVSKDFYSSMGDFEFVTASMNFTISV